MPAFNEFQHQIVRSHVVYLADVRMVQGGDTASFFCEAFDVLALQPLNGHDTVKSRAFHTSPMTPSPTGASNRYGPTCIPDSQGVIVLRF